MVKFPIVIKAGSQRFHLVAELIDRGKRFETFKIYPEKKPDKFVLLQNNRPMIRAKGLKHKSIQWTVVEGEIKYRQLYIKRANTSKLSKNTLQIIT